MTTVKFTDIFGAQETVTKFFQLRALAKSKNVRIAKKQVNFDDGYSVLEWTCNKEKVTLDDWKVSFDTELVETFKRAAFALGYKFSWEIK